MQIIPEKIRLHTILQNMETNSLSLNRVYFQTEPKAFDNKSNSLLYYPNMLKKPAYIHTQGKSMTNVRIKNYTNILTSNYQQI